jgi:hypothetical protein
MGRLESDARTMTEHATAISQCLVNLAPSETAASGAVWQGSERRSPTRPWSKKLEPTEPPPTL